MNDMMIRMMMMMMMMIRIIRKHRIFIDERMVVGTRWIVDNNDGRSRR